MRLRSWQWNVRRPGNRWKPDRKSTRLNSSHLGISYAVFCLKKKKGDRREPQPETRQPERAPAHAADEGGSEVTLDPLDAHTPYAPNDRVTAYRLVRTAPSAL